MSDSTSNFIVIHTLSNRFEGDLLSDALKKEDIPVIVRSFEETAYDGLFVKQRGWGCLMVPDDLAFQACRITEPIVNDLQSRNLYSDPAEVDPLLWEKLRAVSPDVVCENAQVRFDSSKPAYVVPFLDTEFLCDPSREIMEARAPGSQHRLNFEFYLVGLHYLLEAQPQGLTGKWISEKDIPGGQLFFQGPHKFPTDRLVKLFGLQPDLFAQASERLGGTPVRMGDVAYRLWPYPRIPLLFVLWQGDDEFEPSLQIRFDGSVHSHLKALDTLWAMVNVVCRSLYAAGRSLSQ